MGGIHFQSKQNGTGKTTGLRTDHLTEKTGKNIPVCAEQLTKKHLRNAQAVFACNMLFTSSTAEVASGA